MYAPRLTPPCPPLIAATAGIGLRGAHISEILHDLPALDWVEVHPDNYFGGRRNRQALRRICEHYPVSFHAVGLSLGADQPVDMTYLKKLRQLCDECAPAQISDHASWSASGNAHFNDLLPLPYTNETLTRLCDNITRVQEALARPILIENPSTYVTFLKNDMDEPDFLNAAARITGCGLLLDINNVHVQAHNHQFNPYTYLDAIAHQYIGEFHLAGHTVRNDLLVDTHNRAIADEVWSLYEYTLARTGPRPTLIEWDADIPALSVLRAEAAKAQIRMDRCGGVHHDAA